MSDYSILDGLSAHGDEEEHVLLTEADCPDPDDPIVDQSRVEVTGDCLDLARQLALARATIYGAHSQACDLIDVLSGAEPDIDRAREIAEEMGADLGPTSLGAGGPVSAATSVALSGLPALQDDQDAHDEETQPSTPAERR